MSMEREERKSEESNKPQPLGSAVDKEKWPYPVGKFYFFQAQFCWLLALLFLRLLVVLQHRFFPKILAVSSLMYDFAIFLGKQHLPEFIIAGFILFIMAIPFYKMFRLSNWFIIMWGVLLGFPIPALIVSYIFDDG